MRILAGIFATGAFLLVGCSSSAQTARYLTPDNRRVLLATSHTIVEGTITDVSGGANLTLQEDLEPYPANPVNGFTQSFNINVDSVVKGRFDGSVLQLNGVQDPKHKHDIVYLKADLFRGKKVYVGWDQKSCGGYENLMLVNAEDQPATQPSNKQ